MRHQAQFVVVVEQHAAVAAHAEILEQQIAGEDVAARQILHRLAVIQHRAFGQRRWRFAHVQVQRAHAALDIAVADHHVLAVHAHGLRALAQQFLQHGRRELPAPEAQAPELLRVHQPPDAVAAEHQAVFLLDIRAMSLG